MMNLIRYTYLVLFGLFLFVFFIGCGDDEAGEVDVGPEVVATPEGTRQGNDCRFGHRARYQRCPSDISHGEKTLKRRI